MPNSTGHKEMMTHQDIAQHQQVTDSTHGTNMVTRKQKNHRHTWLSVNKGKHNKQKYVLYTVIGSPTPARDKVGGCCDGQSSPVLGGCSAGLPRWRGVGAMMMVARLVAPPLHRHHTSGACVRPRHHLRLWGVEWWADKLRWGLECRRDGGPWRRNDDAGAATGASIAAKAEFSAHRCLQSSSSRESDKWLRFRTRLRPPATAASTFSFTFFVWPQPL